MEVHISEDLSRSDNTTLENLHLYIEESMIPPSRHVLMGATLVASLCGKEVTTTQDVHWCSCSPSWTFSASALSAKPSAAHQTVRRQLIQANSSASSFESSFYTHPLFSVTQRCVMKLMSHLLQWALFCYRPCHSCHSGLKMSVPLFIAILMIYQYRNSEIHRLYRVRCCNSLKRWNFMGEKTQQCLCFQLCLCLPLSGLTWWYCLNENFYIKGWYWYTAVMGFFLSLYTV